MHPRLTFLHRLHCGALMAVGFATVITAGCARHPKTSPPLVPPQVSASVQYRPGPLLAAPITRPTAVNVSDALSVEVEWHALTAIPPALRRCCRTYGSSKRRTRPIRCLRPGG